MIFRKLTAQLARLYDAREAQAIARLVMEERFGLSLTDIAMGRDDALSISEREDLRFIASELAKGRPVQHILGHAPFCGRSFIVNPDVLIPRPETEAIPDIVAEAFPTEAPASILDIGTGSGCIAVTLALAYPAAAVTAIDISPRALATARRNAGRLGAANVTFACTDALRPAGMLQAIAAASPAPSGAAAPETPAPRFDIIVSNPPYVRRSEAAAIHANVRDHEPGLALYVGDDDPLLFYRAIAATAAAALTPGGIIVVEANTALTAETAAVFAAQGFHTGVRTDCYGRPRFVVAR